MRSKGAEGMRTVGFEVADGVAPAGTDGPVVFGEQAPYPHDEGHVSVCLPVRRCSRSLPSFTLRLACGVQLPVSRNRLFGAWRVRQSVSQIAATASGRCWRKTDRQRGRRISWRMRLGAHSDFPLGRNLLARRTF